MEKTSPIEYDIEKLRWQCRRGMLELDYLLDDFLMNHFNSLDAQQQAMFVELLSCPDPELNSWLLDKQVAEDEAIQSMVALVREKASGRR